MFKMEKLSLKSQSLLVLTILLPVPSIGTLCGMVWLPGHILGATLYLGSKIWILVIPLVWTIYLQKEKISWSQPRLGGFGFAIISGLGFGIIIYLVYILLAPGFINIQVVQSMWQEVGQGSLRRYLIGVGYWIFINSLLEEYVWRWFVLKQARRLFRNIGAVLLASLGFTIHHIIALHIYLSWPMTILSCTAIFFGSIIWSCMYIKYKSIWPGYVSHALIDITVFYLGYKIIF